MSAFKMVLLFVMTFGTYQMYWFYKHWKCYQPYAGKAISPFWRMFFAIFFTHSLFQAFHLQASRNYATKSLQGTATLYVVLVLAERVLDQLSASSDVYTAMDLVSLALMFVVTLPLVVAQGVANKACGDPEGQSNSKLTLVNYGFIALGGITWLGFGYAYFLPQEFDPQGFN